MERGRVSEFIIFVFDNQSDTSSKFFSKMRGSSLNKFYFVENNIEESLMRQNRSTRIMNLAVSKNFVGKVQVYGNGALCVRVDRRYADETSLFLSRIPKILLRLREKLILFVFSSSLDRSSVQKKIRLKEE